MKVHSGNPPINDFLKNALNESIRKFKVPPVNVESALIKIHRKKNKKKGSFRHFIKDFLEHLPQVLSKFVTKITSETLSGIILEFFLEMPLNNPNAIPP